LIVFGVHQCYYADLRTVFLPPWPLWRVEDPSILAYVTGVIFIAVALSILFSKKGKESALVLGTILLAITLFWHLPYILFIQPHQIRHLGIWAEASKCLALAGGALVVAGSFIEESKQPGNKSAIMKIFGKLIAFGPICFCITMIEFGVDHFLYIDSIKTLVPAWIPGNIYWTYFAGVALIASGIAIIFRVKVQIIAILLGVMIFLWLVMLHIPRAIELPELANGNEIVSSADALAFSGIAFIIAAVRRGSWFKVSDL
jgi:uncharacterized membrane protein